MIQFLRFGNMKIENTEFSIISGKERAIFFLKRILMLILFVYSTLFIAAAIPFVKTPSIPIYFIGGFATAVFIIRFVNHITKYLKFRSGSIQVTSDSISVKNRTGVEKIPATDISYLEYNFLGNVIIRHKDGKLSFPLTLLAETERQRFMGLFEDMAPR